MDFSTFNRPHFIQKAVGSQYDLLVIGGGITGAGIALDAASRGLKTALVEKNDFSSGTSSKSTKLIHGGLRYLKQFEVALVREVGQERAIVHKLAPHLVTAEKMLLPLTEDGTFGKLMTSVGLMVYDILAGVESADQRIMLDKNEALEKEPLLNKEEVIGGGLYAEYRTDDSRLTMEAIKTAVSHGAICLNYTEVIDFKYADGKVNKAICKDLLTDEEVIISAKKIVSAAGPWVDELRDKDGSLKGKKLHLTKGVHLVFPQNKLPVKQAIYFDVPDGRMIFAIPRGKITYVGTTDTDYYGDKNKILTEKADAQYLIDSINNMFNDINLTIDDVASTWAGVRPLIHEEGKSASELSRKDEIFESGSGLLSIAGGKLTGYRKMAEKIVDVVMEKLEDSEGLEFVKCKTKTIAFSGGPFEHAEAVAQYRESIGKRLSSHKLNKYHAWYLVATYGKQSDPILEKFNELESQFKSAEEALLEAEIEYCLKNEMVASALDFIIRRTGRLFFDIDSIAQHKEFILNSLSKKLNWGIERENAQQEAIDLAIFEASEIFKG
ncbi:MAG: glycerol-3-phosphate dehydrogenase/oxidase [Cyclobacteriaceae bacterium]